MRDGLEHLRILWRLRNWNERGLPDFLIIGAQKAGTSSLFRYLKQHSRIRPPISLEPKGLLYPRQTRSSRESWFRAQFPSQKEQEKGAIIGAVNPNLLFHPLAPQRIKQIIPEVKLIVLLRNPIQRAYSHYHMNIRLGRFEPLSFEDAIEKEDERLKGAKEEILSEQGGWGSNHRYRLYSYKTRGIYINSLKPWFNQFPRNQFLVLSTQQLLTKPVTLLKRVTQFLNIPHEGLLATRKYNVGKYPKMKASTRTELRKFFTYYNQQLHELLSTDFKWE